MAEEKILLSACLAGVPCTYKGEHKSDPVFEAMARRGQAVLFCPEVLGGMTIPHPPSEIVCRRGDGHAVLAGRSCVVSQDGEDVTEFFIRGAGRALRLAREAGIGRAVLKARSPSCGCAAVYDGTFTGRVVPGDGVTAALLKQNGISVESDEAYRARLAGRSDGRKSRQRITIGKKPKMSVTRS